MTGRELLAALQALPDEQLDLDVEVPEYWHGEGMTTAVHEVQVLYPSFSAERYSIILS